MVNEIRYLSSSRRGGRHSNFVYLILGQGRVRGSQRKPRHHAVLKLAMRRSQDLSSCEKRSIITGMRGWTNTLEKTNWKRIIDLVLYLLFCALAGTGFLLAYRLPHGGGGGHTLFLGMGRHAWGEVHTWIAYATVIVAAIHFGLNWQWLVNVAASKRPWRLGLGIATGLLIVSLFVFAPTEPALRGTSERARTYQIDR